MDLISLSQRFTTLTASKRRAFFDRLHREGLNFETLPIIPRNPVSPIPLAYAQRALWLAWKLAPQSPAYNLVGRLDITAPYSADTVKNCLRTLVQRHSILRTVYPTKKDGQPIQKIEDELVFEWSVQVSNEQIDNRALLEVGRHFAEQPFDLESGPVFRGMLYTFKDEKKVLFLAIHHIAADGGSVNLLLQEFIELLKLSQTSYSDKVSILQYADYAIWQQQWLEAGELDRQLNYWRTQLADTPLCTALPIDRPRNKIRNGHGDTISFSLPHDTTKALSALAHQHSASLYMVTVALLNLLLYRYGGNSDLCIGVPSANRDRAELANMIGHFTNVLVLRTQLNSQLNFASLLLNVRACLLDAKCHQDVPLDILVETLAIPRTLGLSPLFQVKCAQQVIGYGNANDKDIQIAVQGVAVEEVHFDMSLDLIEEGNKYSWQLAYATDLFDRATILRLVETFQDLAAKVAINPKQALGAIDLVGIPSILRGIDRLWSHDSVMTLFFNQVTQYPHSPALVQYNKMYSYSELYRASERWASYLAYRGIGPENRVALHIERSSEFVMAMLAVLKTGATFVPLDPSLPQPRLQALLKDCSACHLLTLAPLTYSVTIPVTIVSFDDLPPEQAWSPPPISPQQAAYIIYTSGSTGQPKGVVISHAALANYVQGMLARLALPRPMRFAMVSTVAADLGHTSLFGALCSGGSLHLFDNAEAFDPDAFAERMLNEGIEILKIVPSHLKGLLHASQPQLVLPHHILILGGEATDTALLTRVKQLCPNLKIVNHYGPTETTVGMLMQTESLPSDELETLPLGYPISQMDAYVLDDQLQPVQLGMVGELYIGGPGIARGYLNQTGLTACRFIASPFESGKRLYRTGDRVRQSKDNLLNFLGRSDNQIKIRGFRVEPEELQNYLRQIAGVENAVVTIGFSEHNTSVLLAYIVPQAGASLDTDKLRLSLKQSLPAYLVPETIILLNELPLTANGKIDSRALPSPRRALETAAIEMPQGPIEEALALIWQEILGVERIARTDNFFALGGDSILSLKLVARIRKHLPNSNGLSLAELMQANSLQDLADRLKKGFEKKHDAICLQASGSGIPLYCLPGLIVNSREFLPLVQALRENRPIYSFISHVYTQKRWRGFEISSLATEYAAFIEATAPQARCALLGWSSGGDLAFDVMHKLEGRVKVEFVGMVDVFESDPLRSQRILTNAQHEQAREIISSWLKNSSMAEHWRELLSSMNNIEHTYLADQLLYSGQELPLDGAGDDAAEYLLWATLDKRVQATRYHYRYSTTPIHVFLAEKSLQAPGTLRAWANHAPVVSTTLIPSTDHLGIIRHPKFFEYLQQALTKVSQV